MRFLETKQFVEKQLEEKYLKEIISVEEVISFLQTQKKRASAENIFYCVVLGFKAETF